MSSDDIGITFERRCIMGRVAHLLTGAEDGTPIPWDDLIPAVQSLRSALSRQTEALRRLDRYTVHVEGCRRNAMDDIHGIEEPSCSCGLAELHGSLAARSVPTPPEKET